MDVLQYPLATEKAIRAIESSNIITFVVDIKASRSTIKKHFQDKFKAKVNSINIEITPTGKKKAFIRLSKEFNAMDIATQLGLM